jgi:hypothetical protein
MRRQILRAAMMAGRVQAGVYLSRIENSNRPVKLEAGGQPQAKLAPLNYQAHKSAGYGSEGFVGGRGRDRTCDQSIKSRMLYQLSYASA